MSNRQFFFDMNDLSQGVPRQLGPGVSTRIFAGDRAMLSFVAIAPMAEGSIHAHAEEQWGILLEGDGVRIQDGVEHAVKAGDFWLTPGGSVHGFRAGPRGARVLDIFSPPRKAYAT